MGVRLKFAIEQEIVLGDEILSHICQQALPSFGEVRELIDLHVKR